MHTTPTCRRCGKQHYNFQTCEEAAKPAPSLQVFWRPRESDPPESNLIELGPGVIVYRRHPTTEESD